MTAKRALISGVLCWGAYILLRSFLQHLIPANSLLSYVLQDCSITVVRLRCAAACLWIARQRWLDSSLGLSAAGSPGPIMVASLFLGLASAALSAMSCVSNWNAALWFRLVELAIALVVASNEEIGFRGLIFNGLRELGGRWLAIIGSSLLFMAMHLGYQPAYSLPVIFMTGLWFALLRDKGMSLKLLILLHFIYDGIFAVALSDNRIFWGYYQGAAALILLAAGLAAMAPDCFARAGEVLLFAYGSLQRSQAAAKQLGILKRCDGLGQACIAGQLIQRDGFPVLIAAESTQQRVPGELLRLRDKPLLAELDAYEGENYLRQRANIGFADGSILETWVYMAASAPSLSSNAPAND